MATGGPTDTSTGPGKASAEDVKNQSEFNELIFQSSARQEKLNELLKERTQ